MAWLALATGIVALAPGEGQAQQPCVNCVPSVGEFDARADATANRLQAGAAALPDLPEVPPDFQTWWQPLTQAPINRPGNPVPVRLEGLIVRALEHSAQIKVFGDLPLIRETAVIEADAAFDWRRFLETRWDDISEPVGNTLTVGPGANRLRDHIWSLDAGVRRRNLLGGEVELSQRFGHQNNNSVFFQPNNQGTSRLRLSYTQPLLKGRGKAYNSSLIVLAQIDARIAGDEFSRQLQAHLLEVSRAYWTLYLERAALLQKQRVFERAAALNEELKRRREIDAVGSQLVRVNAAVTERRATLVRSQMAVKNAEARIHALVNDRELALIPDQELIPLDAPTRIWCPLDSHAVVFTALRQRPEVGQALKQTQAAAVRLNMSKNELLPQLDVVLQSYVAGLRGQSDIPAAWEDQFTQGEPSYSAGLVYSVPLGRRAQFARHQRRRLELRQLQNQFRATVETLILEVEVASREVHTAYREAQAKFQSMAAAEKQLQFIEQRWRRLPGEDRSVSLYLEDVLAAQERLGDAEFGFAQAEVTYNLALMNLKRAMGTLLQDERVEQGLACVDHLPTNVLTKQPWEGTPLLTAPADTPFGAPGDVPGAEPIGLPPLPESFPPSGPPPVDVGRLPLNAATGANGAPALGPPSPNRSSRQFQPIRSAPPQQPNSAARRAFPAPQSPLPETPR